MTNTKTISSQRFLDDEIVEAKRAASDYIVTVFAVEFDGETYEIVVDGHHSLAAARADGVEPVIVSACGELYRQLAGELETVGVEAFLENHYNGDEWYDIATGRNVW